MIIGLGVDMVDLRRIGDIIKKRGDRFVKKVFTEREIRNDDIKEIGAKFAAKEAFVKALGTGFQGVKFKEIEVLNDKLGKPYYEVNGSVLERFKDIRWAASLSLTHEQEYAVAVAILEKL